MKPESVLLVKCTTSQLLAEVRSRGLGDQLICERDRLKEELDAALKQLDMMRSEGLYLGNSFREPFMRIMEGSAHPGAFSDEQFADRVDDLLRWAGEVDEPTSRRLYTAAEVARATADHIAEHIGLMHDTAHSAHVAAHTGVSTRTPTLAGRLNDLDRLVAMKQISTPEDYLHVRQTGELPPMELDRAEAEALVRLINEPPPPNPRLRALFEKAFEVQTEVKPAPLPEKEELPVAMIDRKRLEEMTTEEFTKEYGRPPQPLGEDVSCRCCRKKAPRRLGFSMSHSVPGLVPNIDGWLRFIYPWSEKTEATYHKLSDVCAACAEELMGHMTYVSGKKTGEGVALLDEDLLCNDA